MHSCRDDRVIEAALAALRQPGGVVLYPTETVYGLGGLAGDSLSRRRIAEMKGVESTGLIVLVNEVPSWLQGLGRELALAFWPGPLTLVVDAPPAFASAARAEDGSVAIRSSSHPLARALVAATGPLTSTSANRHGEPPLLRAEGSDLGADAVVDGGVLPSSPPSTIVDARTGTVLRRGAEADAVSALLGSSLAAETTEA